MWYIIYKDVSNLCAIATRNDVIHSKQVWFSRYKLPREDGITPTCVYIYTRYEFQSINPIWVISGRQCIFEWTTWYLICSDVLSYLCVIAIWNDGIHNKQVCVLGHKFPWDDGTTHICVLSKYQQLILFQFYVAPHSKWLDIQPGTHCRV